MHFISVLMGGLWPASLGARGGGVAGGVGDAGGGPAGGVGPDRLAPLAPPVPGRLDCEGTAPSQGPCAPAGGCSRALFCGGCEPAAALPGCFRATLWLLDWLSSAPTLPVELSFFGRCDAPWAGREGTLLGASAAGGGSPTSGAMAESFSASPSSANGASSVLSSATLSSAAVSAAAASAAVASAACVAEAAFASGRRHAKNARAFAMSSRQLSFMCARGSHVASLGG
mmetsp:Transcript_96018/g.266732  ORF Transcript_96018/g.266732 Transcript_96018/m.266732 type:complete len:228 (-) Transcript_96018:223-906(-)